MNFHLQQIQNYNTINTNMKQLRGFLVVDNATVRCLLSISSFKTIPVFHT